MVSSVTMEKKGWKNGEELYVGKKENLNSLFIEKIERGKK
jgi:hypothetical protein